MIFKKLFHSKRRNSNISNSFEKSKKEESLWQFQEIICSTPKYKIIEDVISVLEKRGFYLKSISTSGQCSGHDCIDAFNHDYATFEDFMENAREDFKEKKECIKGFAELDWSCSHFHLFNEDHGFNIDISIGESNGTTTPIGPYVFFQKEDVCEQDEMFLEQIIMDLDAFIKT